MSEIWKPVPSAQGMYEASSYGRIRSVRRRGGNARFYGGRTIKPVLNPVTGYCQIGLSINNKVRLEYAHRLVCEAFHGPANGRDVNHKNGVRSDNHPDNLEWMTKSQNQAHAYANLPKKRQPTACGVALLFPDKTAFIFPTQGILAKFLGVCAGSVSSAARRRHQCAGYEVSHV